MTILPLSLNLPENLYFIKGKTSKGNMNSSQRMAHHEILDLIALTDAVCITSVAACMAMIRCQLETQQTKKRWKWIEPTIGIVSLGTYYRHLLTMDCPNIKAVPRYHCAYYMLWSHANTHGFGIPPSINCFPASNGAGFPTTLETWNSYAFRMPAIKWASSYACQLAAEAWCWP